MTLDPSSDYKSDAGTTHSDLFPALIATERKDKGRVGVSHRGVPNARYE